MQEEYNDNQLIGLIHEASEEAKDLLYEKYQYIIDVEVKKYLSVAKLLEYDYNDLYQDGLVGFADALNSYRDDKNMSLSSFITLCISRRLQAAIIKAGRLKNKLMTEALSLDHKYDSLTAPLKDLLGDNESDPLENIINEEKFQELVHDIKKSLSKNEYEVYTLLVSGLKPSEITKVINKTPKQIDNTLQRLKNKIKKLLDNE